MGYSSLRGKERRKDRRLPLPVFSVKVDGVVYHTMNWSLGGLLVEGYDGQLKGGETIQIDLKAKDATADFRMKVNVQVIRVVPGETLALQFEAMSPPLYEFFERCFAARFKR
jgi:hypothetical protein